MSAPMRRSLPRGLDEEVDATIRKWLDDDMVARIWARDPSVWTGSGEQDWLGWLDVASDEATHADRFTDLVDDVRSAGFTDAVVLGMGGSSLCPDVLATTFPPQAGLPRLRVLDSTDPQQVKAMQDVVDLPTTLFFVSSKSGTTLEPNIFAAYFFERVTRGRGRGQAGRGSSRSPTPGPRSRIWHGVRGIAPSSPACHRSAGATRRCPTSGWSPARPRRRRRGTARPPRATMAHACSASIPAGENPGLVLGAVIGACANAGRDKLTLLTSPA